MAREAEKSVRETKPTTEDDASSSSKAKETAGARDSMASASGGSAEEAREPAKDSVAEFQDQQNKELKAVLAKRSQKSDARTIVREFVARWLPRHLVEAEDPGAGAQGRRSRRNQDDGGRDSQGSA